MAYPKPKKDYPAKELLRQIKKNHDSTSNRSCHDSLVKCYLTSERYQSFSASNDFLASISLAFCASFTTGYFSLSVLNLR